MNSPARERQRCAQSRWMTRRRCVSSMNTRTIKMLLEDKVAVICVRVESAARQHGRSLASSRQTDQRSRGAPRPSLACGPAPLARPGQQTAERSGRRGSPVCTSRIGPVPYRPVPARTGRIAGPRTLACAGGRGPLPRARSCAVAGPTKAAPAFPNRNTTYSPFDYDRLFRMKRRDRSWISFSQGGE